MTSRGLNARDINRILDSLSAAEAALVLPQLELVPLNLDAVLADEGVAMTHVYFPVSGLISLVTNVDGIGVESAAIGAEGMVGLSVFLQAGGSSSNSVVQMSGQAWRIPVAAFLHLLDECAGLNASLKRYIAGRLWTTYRSAACDQLHSIPVRSARWLLLAHDNATADTFQLTHRLLSQMLGVRRASVTTALGALQEQGLISYRRGSITILNRPLLEAEACECDGLIRARNNISL